MWIWVPLLVLAFFMLGCGTPEREADFTFIHATDPHLFEEPGKQRPGTEPEPLEVRRHKEKLNTDALTAFFESIRSVSGGDSSRRVVILTGDFGIDQSWTDQAKPQRAATKRSPEFHRRAEQVKHLAGVLKSSSVPDVYVVPGNNDLEDERATDEALSYVGQFFQDVQKELAGSAVTLHDLTACYQAKSQPLAGCVADVPGTAVRLIGFPSYSFKNSTKDAYTANQKLQQAQMEKFASLIAEAKAKEKKVLVLSHIPDLDDPLLLARERFTGVAPDLQGNAQRPRWSGWNVSAEMFGRWKELVDSPTVLAVLAGHFHDSHREIYRRPYRWSSPSQLRPDPNKLFLSPPLAVKLQDTSPIQARGFSVLRLTGSDLAQRLYWYDAGASKFEGDPLPRHRDDIRPGFVPGWLWALMLWFRDLLLGLWNLGGDLKPLERITVVFLALLLAFLTVAILWNVPPGPTELTGPVAEAPAGNPPKPTEKPAGQREAPTPFTSNLGKTVISGLSGLAVVSFLEPFWQKAGILAKTYYLVWFISTFFALLLITACLRGLTEAFRSRLASEHRPPQWQHRDPCKSNLWECVRYLWQIVMYWRRRLWLWVLSWRPTILVFFDTSLSVVFGENVLRNAVLSDTIANLQLSMIVAADRVREAITISVRHALINARNEEIKARPASDKSVDPSESQLDDSAVRVAISVLAPDNLSAFYISWARGSLVRDFDRNSVAWVAISAGVVRWWRESFSEPTDLTPKIVIFDNRGRKLPEREGLLYLNHFFQARASHDYKAFIVIPVPRREADGEYWRAGIHISFSEEGDLARLWPDFKLPDGPTDEKLGKLYENADRALDRTMLKDPELRAVLNESIEVLTALLRRFNAVIYQTYVKPRLFR